jgi:oligoribonuclease
MVWIDVETTGLDTDLDTLLEIALLITDAQLEPLAGSSYVVHCPLVLDLPMTPFVREMHTENGLLEECRQHGYFLHDIDTRLAALLTQQGIDGNAPLCGSTIHFDRAFVKRDLPLTHARLHYRNVDVSSLKELVLRWAPEMEYPKKDYHRAMPDIHESIKALRHYRRAFGL